MAAELSSARAQQSCSVVVVSAGADVVAPAVDGAAEAVVAVCGVTSRIVVVSCTVVSALAVAYVVGS